MTNMFYFGFLDQIGLKGKKKPQIVQRNDDSFSYEHTPYHLSKTCPQNVGKRKRCDCMRLYLLVRGPKREVSGSSLPRMKISMLIHSP